MIAGHEYDMRAVEEAGPFPNKLNLISETPLGSVHNANTVVQCFGIFVDRHEHRLVVVGYH